MFLSRLFRWLTTSKSHRGASPRRRSRPRHRPAPPPLRFRTIQHEPLEGRALLAILYDLFPDAGGPQDNAYFGWAVAASDNYLVVGAPSTSILGQSQVGQAFVYNSAGALLWTLDNPTPASGDQFGWSVAVSDNYVVVGAILDDTTAEDAGAAYVYYLSSTTPTVPFATLSHPLLAAGDRFGYSVAVGGNRAVVGATFGDTSESDSGSAFVYDLSSGNPATPLTTLVSPTPSNGDQFGFSVGVSGSNVVVGEPYDDAGAADTGAAYVYDLASATPATSIHTLVKSTPAASDSFGYSVAVSGNHVVVGATFDDTDDADAGAAYAYRLNGAAPPDLIATLVDPTPDAFPGFGYSVAVSGNHVVVGAIFDDTGAADAGSAYVFDISSATPASPIATLNSWAPASSDYFGWSVAVSGNRVVVGAVYDDREAADGGSAYLFDLTGGSPETPVAALENLTPAALDSFGNAVAVSGDYVVVGAFQDNSEAPNAGSVYVYDLSSATPTTPLAKIDNPSPDAFDQFGISVAVSGNYLVVGANQDDTVNADSGSAYVYDLSGPTPTLFATLHSPAAAIFDYFGSSVAVSGNYVVVGAFLDDTATQDAGAVHVYDLSSLTPTTPIVTLLSPTPSIAGYFGLSVAASGTRVVVGAYLEDTGASDAGSAYVFDLNVSLTTPIATLNNPAPSANDLFGYSVAASGDYIIVGALLDDAAADNAGAAYVYDLNVSLTTPIATLLNPNATVSDFFGVSVAVSGTDVVVGAYLDGAFAPFAGAAYVYDLSSPTPETSLETLSAHTPASSDLFGYAVAVSGDYVAVGAFADDTQNVDQGAAYVHLLRANTVTVSATTQGNEAGPASVVFTISQKSVAATDTVVDFTLGGTANTGTLGNTDYTPPSSNTVTIPAGSTTATVTIPVLDDAVVEGDETITLTLILPKVSGDANVVPDRTPATATIVDDDQVTLTISDVSQPESGAFVFTITADKAVSQPMTVLANTSDGTAAWANGDYGQVSDQLVTIPAGSTSATVTVTVYDDDLVEEDETFTVTLSDAQLSGAPFAGLSIGNGSATGTIINDDKATLTISDNSLFENNNLGFSITSDKIASLPMTVTVSTSSGTAGAADYTTIIAAIIEIPAFDNFATVVVTVEDDLLFETDEDFFVHLSSARFNGLVDASRVTIGDNQAQGAIQDNDSPPVADFSVKSQTVSEDVVAVTIAASLSAPAGIDVTIPFSLSGSATEGSDFTADDTSIVIPAGSTMGSATVGIVDDTAVEHDETVILTMEAHASYTGGATTSHTITITDNDTAVVSVANPGVNGVEGGVAVTFTVTQSGPSETDTVVSYSLSGATADVADPAGGVATILAGSTSATVTLPVENDLLIEGPETVEITLTSATSSPEGLPAELGPAVTASATIEDNDFATLTLSGTASATEGGSGGLLTLTLTLNANGTSGTGTLATAITGISPQSPNATNDFTSNTGAFDVGATSGVQLTLAITAVNDTIVEGLESLAAPLTALNSNAKVVTASTATVNITDNDSATLKFAAGSSSFNENAGTVNVGVTLVITANGVVNSGTLGKDVSVKVQRTSGSATSGSDYTYSPNPKTVQFNSGAASGTRFAAVTILNNAAAENDETIAFTLNTLIDGTGGRVALVQPTTHTLTIRDPAATLDFGDAPNTYTTMLAANGPRHTAGGPRLGADRSKELNARTPLVGTSDTSDDGITVAALTPGSTATITVVVTGATGRLDAFVDLNRDGDFADAGEKIFSSVPLTVGTHNLSYAVPTTAVPGPTYARFRLSTAGGLSFNGAAPTGEVEDYPVRIERVAFGTSGNDTLTIVPVTPTGTVEVRRVGAATVRFLPSERIIVMGLAGNDTIRVTGALNRGVFVYGGTGNDTLIGSSQDDLLVGGDGNDTIRGLAGRDILIGGNGVDQVFGNGNSGAGNDENVLIGNRTQLDGNDQALAVLLTEWSSANDFATRRTKLKTGINGARLSSATVLNDSAVDTLVASSGQNWFWNYAAPAASPDTMTGKKATDALN